MNPAWRPPAPPRFPRLRWATCVNLSGRPSGARPRAIGDGSATPASPPGGVDGDRRELNKEARSGWQRPGKETEFRGEDACGSRHGGRQHLFARSATWASSEDEASAIPVAVAWRSCRLRCCDLASGSDPLPPRGGGTACRLFSRATAGSFGTSGHGNAVLYDLRLDALDNRRRHCGEDPVPIGSRSHVGADPGELVHVVPHEAGAVI